MEDRNKYRDCREEFHLYHSPSAPSIFLLSSPSPVLWTKTRTETVVDRHGSGETRNQKSRPVDLVYWGFNCWVLRVYV